MNIYYDNILLVVANPFSTQIAVDNATILNNPCRSVIHLAQQLLMRNPFFQFEARHRI
jgi:hypothetical protein